eukprot:GHVN01051846.1.p1 GENE.GHVN01051846.1~~GHVN01051846.1.p1  ORF type:complete len:283 (+),score=58.63 GHVN01051846.1:47-895(+)
MRFSVDHAPSEGSSCTECNKALEKESIRLGFNESDGEDGTKFYHPPCFARFCSSQKWCDDHCPPQIEEFIGAGNITSDEKAQCDKLLDEIVVPASPTKRPRLDGDIGKGGDGKESDESGSDSGGDEGSGEDKSESDEDFDEGERGRKRKAPKAKAKTKAKGKAKGKAKEVPLADDDPGVLDDQEFEKIAKEADELQKKTVAQLKSMLQKNAARVTGKKDELVMRVAEHKILGVPPKCSSCGGGQLKFSRGTGNFSCPGFFDDGVFRRCGFEGKDVKTNAWKA